MLNETQLLKPQVQIDVARDVSVAVLSKTISVIFRKEARVVVDGALKNEIRTAKEPVRALQLTTGLALGAALDHKDGFVGCMRALLLNGRPIDLSSYARRGESCYRPL